MDKKKVGTDPNGYPIYREMPENTAIPITQAAKLHKENTYTITEHDTGQKYTITEHKQEQPKQEINSEQLQKEVQQLIAEIESKPKQEQPKPQTKWDKEIERSKKYYDEYYRNNPSKIRYNIFEEIEHAFDY